MINALGFFFTGALSLSFSFPLTVALFGRGSSYLASGGS